MGQRFVERVFSTKTPEGQRDIYDQWSATYEREIFSSGYRTPAVIAAAFVRFVAPDSGPVLDAGCGGGLQSEPLALLGYGPIIGIDISPGMLSVARAKSIYTDLQVGPLGEDLPFADNHFAAFISAGVLSLRTSARRCFAGLGASHSAWRVLCFFSAQWGTDQSRL